LGDQAFAAAVVAGRAWRLEDAIAEALRPTPPGAEPLPPASRLRTLTPREQEVAQLITLGLTNRQIAERLIISERTADTHVQNILAKLGCVSRAQVAAKVATAAGPT
jgi:non-specific serine/threonine protein kinase